MKMNSISIFEVMYKNKMLPMISWTTVILGVGFCKTSEKSGPWSMTHCPIVLSQVDFSVNPQKWRPIIKDNKSTVSTMQSVYWLLMVRGANSGSKESTCLSAPPPLPLCAPLCTICTTATTVYHHCPPVSTTVHQIHHCAPTAGLCTMVWQAALYQLPAWYTHDARQCEGVKGNC